MSLLLWKHVYQKQHGERKTIWLIDCSSSMQKAKVGTLRQEPKQRRWRSASDSPVSKLMIGHLSFTAQIHLFKSTVGWALSHQVGIKKTGHQHAHRPIGWRPFLWEEFLFPCVLSWQIKLPMIPQSHRSRRISMFKGEKSTDLYNGLPENRKIFYERGW